MILQDVRGGYLFREVDREGIRILLERQDVILSFRQFLLLLHVPVRFHGGGVELEGILDQHLIRTRCIKDPCFLNGGLTEVDVDLPVDDLAVLLA